MVTKHGLWLPLAVLGWSSCTTPPVSANKHESTAAAPVVGYTLLKPQHLSREVVLTGEFRAYQSVDLYARISGFLRQVRVDAGSVVREGDILATLEVPEMDSDMAQTAAERRRTEAELGRAKAELGRAEANLKLVNVSLTRLLAASKAEPGIIAQQEIDEAQAKKDAAAAQVEASRATIGVEESRIGVARAGEKRSQTMAEYRTIVAPFSGVVVKRYSHPGALTQSTPVLRLAEVGRLRLAAQVPDSVVPLIKPSETVTVRISALNRTLTARVSRLTRDVSAASRTMEVEIDVPNADGTLAPGMYADVILQAQKAEEGWIVPITAVINAGGNRTVWIANSSGTVEERPIRTGIETAAGYEVLDGLGKEDRIIVSNRSLLHIGQRVTAQPAGDR